MSVTVALIGFMGAGKTTVGRAVAARLGLPFVDTDALIAREHGPIETIFDVHGESRFRELEREVVCRELAAAAAMPGVVALGGGAVTIADVRDALARVAHVVWLDAPPDVLFARASGGGRPLARDEAAFRELCDSRRPLYESAATDVVDCAAGEGADDVVERVLEAVE